MPITTTTKLQLPANQLPTGVSNEALTEADYVGREDFELVLTPASTYDNDNQATAISAIKTGVKTYVDGTLAPTDLALDVDNVVGETIITSIIWEPDSFTPGDLKNQYKVTIPQYRVKARFVWYNNA